MRRVLELISRVANVKMLQSLHIASVKMNTCRNMYPFLIVFEETEDMSEKKLTQDQQMNITTEK